MNKKIIPSDIERRIELELRSENKAIVFARWAGKLGMSTQTLYRLFVEGSKQYPERVPYEWVRRISSIKFMSLDKKGKTLSTQDAIVELQRRDALPQDFPYHRSTIDRLLRKYQLDVWSLTQPAPAVHLVSHWSNQVHEVDATVAPTYYLNNFGRVAWDPFLQARHTVSRRNDTRLILYSGWDHLSSVLYAKYFIAPGENSVDLFQFLHEFWSRKKDNALPFYGLPLQYLYTDQGGIWKSKSIVSLMTRLGSLCGFVHKRHMPGAPRATGGVESSFNTLMRFEKKLRIRIKFGEHPTVEELNGWLYEFLVDVDNDKQSGREGMSRCERWVENVAPQTIKCPPPLIEFLKMAYTRGETRQINKFTEISWHGKDYYLHGLEDLSGREVLVWFGLKEDAIYVEHLDDLHGPFYPGRHEVEFGSFRRPQLTRYEKTKRELKAVSEELLGKKADSGFEDPTYVRQDNVQHRKIAGSEIEPAGGATDATPPVQQYFTPQEAMLYIAMTIGIYWDDMPPELRDFVTCHLEDMYFKKGNIDREYLDSMCAKLEPVLDRHGYTGEKGSEG